MKTFFHLAFPVDDLQAARSFYVDGLGCQAGREDDDSLILNLGGNQIVCQLVDTPLPAQKGIYPRHFGLIFQNKSDWEALIARAKEKKLKFFQPPKIRNAGTPIEHRTFFLQDPSNNLLEFKHYTQESAIFREEEIHKVGD
jgi:hypothetical protein